MYNVTNVFQMIDRFFGNRFWLGLLLAALLYAFLRGNRDHRIALVAAIATFFLFTNNWVLDIMERLNEKDVYYRNLWTIPVMTIIWLAFLDLFRRWRCTTARVMLVVAAAAVLVFVQPEPPLKTYIQAPLDLNLVPVDVIQLSDALDGLQNGQDRKLLVLCPPVLRDAMALYNGKVRLVDETIAATADLSGEAVIASKQPDVEHIITSCCNWGVDYAIIPRSKGSVRAFRAAGHKPVFKSDGYVIYACDGCPRIIQFYNDWGQVIWQSWVDAQGQLFDNHLGYAVVRYGYDGEGRRVSETFFDHSEAPVLIDGRFETRFTYNRSRQVIEEAYYDAVGAPVIRTDVGYAARRMEYDRQGRVYAECYFDIEGMPTRCAAGFAACTRVYDEAGQLVSEDRYDEDGQRISITAG